MDYGDLSGLEIPARGIVIVLALGEENQPALRITLGHAPVECTQVIAGQYPPGFQLEKFELHQPKKPARVGKSRR